jgi:endonuclease YncB( thermonuclease family)
MIKNLIPAIIFFILLPSFALAAEPSYTARVVSIADGDTITVLNADNRQIKIRLYGIDCPERKQPYGNRARQAIAKAVMGQTVNIHPMSTDRYGRTVALVAAPGREMLNTWLVKQGLAWVYERYCGADICDRMRQLEREASAKRKGLWADQGAVAPWQWRQLKAVGK